MAATDHISDDRLTELISSIAAACAPAAIVARNDLRDAASALRELAALRRPVADDEALAVIVKDLRELQQPWRDLDVDDRNALTAKWRGLLRRPVAGSEDDSFSCDNGNCLSQQCTRCAVDPNGDDPKAYEGTGFYAPAEIRAELSALAAGAHDQADSVEKSWSDHCRAIKHDPERFSSANPTIVINHLISALDAAQREIQQQSEARAELRMALSDSMQHAAELQAEIARLSSPPEERREIVERQKQRREMTCGMPNVPLDDIDTLLQDAARYRNAHDVLLAERDGLQNQLRIMGSLCDNNARAMAELTAERDRGRQDCRAIEEHCNQQIREAERRIRDSQASDQRTIGDLMGERDAARRNAESWQRLQRETADALVDSEGREVNLRARLEDCRQFFVLMRPHVGSSVQRMINDALALAAADGQQTIKCERCADTGRRWDAGGDMSECECRLDGQKAEG